jgi:hypothetical protein
LEEGEEGRGRGEERRGGEGGRGSKKGWEGGDGEEGTEGGEGYPSLNIQDTIST